VTDDITIRLIDEHDSIPELTALLHRSYASLAAMGLRYTATHQSDDVTRKRIAGAECYLAFNGDTLCGTITFRSAAATSGTPWYDRPDVASCGQFCVDPNLQSKGLGLRLIQLAEARAIATGAKEFALDTAEPAHHLIGWYTRLGFRFIEHTQWRDTNYRSVVLSKTLTT
jgi:GNAT superfamily N-acetyltransferase